MDYNVHLIRSLRILWASQFFITLSDSSRLRHTGFEKNRQKYPQATTKKNLSYALGFVNNHFRPIVT